MKSSLNTVVKFIDVLYKPSEIIVDDTDNNEIIINVYMDEIGEEYVTNRSFHNIKKLKEMNFEKKIRNDLYNYLGIMTSGVSLNGFAPYVHRGITIDVHLK